MPGTKRHRVVRRQTRSSLRLQGLSPPSNKDLIPPKAVHLPTELRVAILEFLEKHDLKKVRLVSKEWSLLATMPLFDKLYISSRDIDIRVYKEVTGHPVLSKAVKELIYDPSTFRLNMCKERYFRTLCSEIGTFTWLWSSGDINSLEPRIKLFIAALHDRVPISELYTVHRQDRFVTGAYQKWKAHAERERTSLGNQFYSELCVGMKNLKRLCSVKTDNTIWTTDFMESRRLRGSVLEPKLSGSPLARQWNPFHLRPAGLRRLRDGGDDELIMHHFHLVVRAMAESGRKIRHFDFCSGGCYGLPSLAFKQAETDIILKQHMLSAYSNLESIELKFDAEHEHENTTHQNPLGILPELLNHMPCLKRLDLRNSAVDCSTYHDAFPSKGKWPQLEVLSLDGFAVEAVDFMHLVGEQMPQLRCLRLYNIELVKGTWEGVVQFMSMLPIQQLHLNRHSYYMHRDGAIWRPLGRSDGATDPVLLKAVEEYVAFGGPHPCLPPDSDPACSPRYLMEMLEEEDSDV